MADNSTLPIGTGGDVIRDKDRAGIKTQIMGRDLNIGGATEILETASALADASAIPTVPGYGAYLFGYNGTSYDRLRSSIANGLSVDVTRLPALAAGTAIVGKFGIDQTTPGTTNLVALSAETTKVIGTVNLAASQTLATVTTVGSVTSITNALPAGANNIGTVNPPAITKGAQGAIGLTTQDLKDAGRNAVAYYMLIPVLSTATDTLQSLTGTKAGATVAATTTPAVVTTGKTFRVTRMAATYIATATSGYGIARLRFNTAGVVAITSPIAVTLAVGAGTPATANSAATEEAVLGEGWEFAAGTGVGVSVQGFSAATATAVGYMFVSLSGYEY